jgi:hypothetical protein
MDRIDVSQDRDQQRAFVNVIKAFEFHQILESY